MGEVIEVADIVAFELEARAVRLAQILQNSFDIAESIPMGRWATSSEIADAIVFLASDMSTFMTGHALVVDGGECI